MVPCSLVVRNYTEEDFPMLLKIYDSASDESPHFIRDEMFLKHFMHYPGVAQDSIIVATENKEITGLAIISVTIEEGNLKQASIIELQARNSSSVQALIQAALSYCDNKDVDVIVVAPPLSPVTIEVFRDWLKFDTGVMMGKLLSPIPLLQALLDNHQVRDAFAGKRIVFFIGGEAIEAKIMLQLVEVSSLGKDAGKSDTWVAVTPEAFLEIAFGKADPYTAYLTGKIRAGSLRNVPTILRLLQMLKLAKPCHVTFGDMM